MEQTLIQIGNSQGIVIPKEMRKKLGIKKGQTISIEFDETANAMLIRPKGAIKNRKVEAEFKVWLEGFLQENAEILDELAVR